MSATYMTEPMAPDDAQSGFRCGVHALDDYLARHAVGNTSQGVGKTFVLRGEDQGPRILGYYTLSMAAIQADALHDVVTARLPNYPLPVALIGRFAVHQGAQGRGVGGRLLGDALCRILEAAAQVGCLGVIIDAKDPIAAQFYTKFGFAPLAVDNWPQRMFLSVAAIQGAV